MTGLHGLPTEDVEHIKLGPNDNDIYEVSAQPLPYLKRALGGYFTALTANEIDSSNVAEVFTAKAHELLSIFIPDLMPLHTWEGFRSEEDMEAGNFDDEYARRVAPTGPQVKLAVKRCFALNSLDLWKGLGQFVDPLDLQQFVGRFLRGEDVLAGMKSLSSSSPSTHPSPPETSGMTTDPMSPAEGLPTEDSASPFPASMPS